MKITKARLRELITEEIEKFVKQEQEAEMRSSRTLRPKKLKQLIQSAAMFWGAAVDAEELNDALLPVWGDLMNIIGSHWEKQNAQIHGCKNEVNAESPACIAIDRALSSWRQTIDPILNELNSAAPEGNRATARFISKNSKAIMLSLDYIPASKKPADLLKTRAYERNI